MRNRTAIRLLYILAVVAGILPPLLLLAYGYRLSVSNIGTELQFVSNETVAKIQSVTDRAAESLKSMANNVGVPFEASDALQNEVYNNPFLEAMVLRQDGQVVAASDLAFGSAPPPDPLPDEEPQSIGETRIYGPSRKGLPMSALVVSYRAGPDLYVDGFVSTLILDEFSGVNNSKSGSRILVFYNGEFAQNELGSRALEFRDAVKNTTGIQQLNAALAAVSKSDKYPIQVAALSDFSAVSHRWAHIGPRFGLAGLLVSVVLCWLVLRTARRLNSVESELREAIKFRELSVYYQPVIDLETNQCVGAEALMRWIHPQRGLTRAGDFIDVAEKTQLILPMTDNVIEIVAEDFKSLLKDCPGLHVAINLAPQHFTNTRILDSIRELLQGAIPIENVIFEITERSLVTGSDSIGRTVMNGLIEYGAKLAIDDFGTGYSNLNYLQRFPVNYLKVDKSFVDDIQSESTSKGLVDQIIRIGKMLNMEVIAEGIEHASQVAYLRNEEVRLAQGWFFGEPMPIEEFRDFVLLHNADAATKEL